MNDPAEILLRLGEQAHAEATPNVDVSRAVIARLSRQRSPIVDRRLAVVLAGACVLSAFGLAALFVAPQPQRDAVSSLSAVAVSGTGQNALWRLLQP